MILPTLTTHKIAVIKVCCTGKFNHVFSALFPPRFYHAVENMLYLSFDKSIKAFSMFVKILLL